MKRYKQLLWGLAGILSLASCSDADVPGMLSDDVYRLEFSVSVRADRADGAQNEETLIKSLYVYAFDDAHRYPDYFVDKVINQEETYKVSMTINGTGPKRFYFFANPPKYVRDVLTSTCPEGTLQTLGIYMRKPIKRMSELPQSADGASNTGGTSGFPMANRMVAYANLGDKERELYLSAEPEKKGGRITRIPIFRSLGKVSVTAWRKDVPEAEVLKITGLTVFNYACDGYFSPLWNTNTTPKTPYWSESVEEPGIAVWNPDLLMNLTEMVRNETQVGVDAVSVLEKETAVLPEHSTQDNAQLISSFYLCQNSYGKKMDGESQEGISDPMGNRTSKIRVTLSDGRVSEIALPYLRRNDHLNIRLAITQNTLEVEFKPWSLSAATPDWDDGVYHPEQSGHSLTDNNSVS